MKPTFKHHMESVLATGLFACLGALPLTWASSLGGFVGRHMLSHTAYSNRIRRNLALVMPELEDKQVREIIKGTWENLGRVACEFPHMQKFRRGSNAPGTIELVGVEHVEKVIAEHGKALFCSAHIGNWELSAMALSFTGVKSHSVYRKANNPVMDTIILKRRAVLHEGAVPKGRDGARDIIRILKAGESVSMLVDQKMNEGLSAPFFGKPAMSPSGIAQIARRFNIPIMPAHCERLDGPSFRVTFMPPLDMTWTEDREADTLLALTKINTIIEGWIRERPGQWLWLHQRWGKI